MAYTAEEKLQIEGLKSWWSKNYKIVIISSVITVIALISWQYWKSHQANKLQQTSTAFSQLFESNLPASEATEQLNDFVQSYSRTNYAALALLEQAKKDVANSDFVQAEINLQRAVDNALDENITTISALRLAAVRLQLTHYDEALNALNNISGSAWQAKKLMLNGAILEEKGDIMGAKSAFQQAMQFADKTEQNWLTIKLNSL